MPYVYPPLRWGDIQADIDDYSDYHITEVYECLTASPALDVTIRREYIRTQASSHTDPDEPIIWLPGKRPVAPTPPPSPTGTIGGRMRPPRPSRASVGGPISRAAGRDNMKFWALGIAILAIILLFGGCSVYAAITNDGVNLRTASADALADIDVSDDPNDLEDLLVDEGLSDEDATDLAEEFGEAKAAATTAGVSHDNLIDAIGEELNSLDGNPSVRDVRRAIREGRNKAIAAVQMPSTDSDPDDDETNEELEEFKTELLAALNGLNTDNEALRTEIADLREEIAEAKRLAELTPLLNEIETLRKQALVPGSTDPGKPSNGTNPPSGNGSGNGQTTMTSCGPITWGPAGPAPGASTNDSAAQVAEAVQVMRIPADDRDYVAVHKFCPGDDTPNGWIIGSSWTESNSVQVQADFLPAGVCIDYDHNVTKIQGTVYHTQVLNPRWSRTQIMSDGSLKGLKATVYWTPCDFPDGTPSWEGNGSKPATTSSQSMSSKPTPAPVTTSPHQCSANPADDLGGAWTDLGGKWALSGTWEIHGHAAWTIHTPNYPGDPGLPPGETEVASLATGYCDAYKGQQ